MEYYSVFESINRNCIIIIHGTIDEICSSSAVSSTVIDIDDFIVELIEMTECFIKELNIKDVEWCHFYLIL